MIKKNPINSLFSVNDKQQLKKIDVKKLGDHKFVISICRGLKFFLNFYPRQTALVLATPKNNFQKFILKSFVLRCPPRLESDLHLC